MRLARRRPGDDRRPRRLSPPPLDAGDGRPAGDLDRGRVAPARLRRRRADVLFVPSLVNRAYVLDLTPERSLMRWLPGQGFRTLLLDWGWPGEAERHFTLTDYVAGRLERALMAAPGPVVLAGYCMGGLLALAAALRRPDRVRALALLATPWDFHAGPDGPRRGAQRRRAAAGARGHDGAHRRAAGRCHPIACSPCSTPSASRRSSAPSPGCGPRATAPRCSSRWRTG